MTIESWGVALGLLAGLAVKAGMAMLALLASLAIVDVIITALVVAG